MIFLKESDILQCGNLFYRIYTYNSSKNDVVMNKVIWNSKKERLEIFHDYEYCKKEEIGEGKKYQYFSNDDPTIQEKFEILKRKSKLMKLANE